MSAVSETKFPPSIDLVIGKCLAKLPRDRYQSAKELAIDLERIKDGKEVTTCLPLSNKQSEFMRQNERSGNIVSPAALLVFAALLSLPLSAGLIWLFTRDHSPRRPEPTAKIEKPLDTAKSPSLTLPEVADDDNVGAKEFSKSEKPYCLNKATLNGKQLKVFSFSQSFSIGNLTYFDEGLPHNLDARGECVIPADASLSLNSNSTVGEFPELLKKFKKDDLSGIAIGKGTSATIMPYVGKMTSLNYLSLPGISYDYQDLPYLSPLTKLADLHIELTPAGITSLSKTKLVGQLSRLSLRGPSNISALLKELAKSVKLEWLDLDHIMLSEADVENITAIKNLKHLSFKNMIVSPENLDQLALLPKLKSLSLHRGVTLDEKSFEVLKKFKNLKTLLLPDGQLDALQEQQLIRALPRLKRIRQPARIYQF